MKTKETEGVKICNFHVSDFHLLTILFPYLNKQIKEGTKIVTVLEKDLIEYADNLAEKIILNNKDKEKILDLNWEKCNINLQEEFENYLRKNIIKKQETIFIINGTPDFISYANFLVTNFLKIKDIHLKNIKFVNCFNISNNDINMKAMLENYQQVLNTLGETKVEDFLCS